MRLPFPLVLFLLSLPFPLPAAEDKPYPAPAQVRAAFLKLLDRPKVPLDVKLISTTTGKDGLVREQLTIASEKKPGGDSALYAAGSPNDACDDTQHESLKAHRGNHIGIQARQNASDPCDSAAECNGTNNCLAVVALGALAQDSPNAGAPAASAVRGLIPTGWYPGAVRVSPDGKRLFVANVKGHGALSQPRVNSWLAAVTRRGTPTSTNAPRPARINRSSWRSTECSRPD